jgi:hypothetical protein
MVGENLGAFIRILSCCVPIPLPLLQSGPLLTLQWFRKARALLATESEKDGRQSMATDSSTHRKRSASRCRSLVDLMVANPLL